MTFEDKQVHKIITTDTHFGLGDKKLLGSFTLHIQCL